VSRATTLLLLLVPDVICVVVCLWATVTDLRSRRIPNALTLAGVLAGLVVNPVVGALLGPPAGVWPGLLGAVGGGLLLLIAFGLLGLINFVGWGDVKLMVAVGALLRWPAALWALAYVALVGGVLGLAYALGRRRLGSVLRNIFTIGRRAVKPAAEGAPPVELHRIPYALAILIGATWAAAAKYLPALRLP